MLDALSSPRVVAIVDILRAHGELLVLDWNQARRDAIEAVCMVMVTAAAVFCVWLAANIAIVLLLLGHTWWTVMSLGSLNIVVATLGLLRVRYLLGKKQFVSTREEIVQSVSALTEGP